MPRPPRKSNESAATVGYEAQLWQMADALRGSMDAAEDANQYRAIGLIVDDAMAGIERDNPALKGVLPKDYARPALDKQRLGQLIDMISNIKVGDEASRAKDVLGRVYEYFLSQFASAEGKKGGEFYTPRYGQESNYTSSRLARMNLAILANPPFNDCARSCDRLFSHRVHS